MQKIMLNGIACMVAGSLLFTACKKDNEETPMEVAVIDNNTGTAESDDVLVIAENTMYEHTPAMRLSAEGGTTAGYCDAVITNNTTEKRITIDFGNGQTCNDGRTRKGKIYIDYTGKYRVPGATQVITLDNYTVNGNKLEGKKTLTHTGTENIANTTRIVVEGARITFSDGKTLEWNSDRIRTWDRKGTDWVFSDDEFTLTGKTNGKSRDGRTFTSQIDAAKPLLWKISCLATSKYTPVSGVISVTPQLALERVIDFGNGDCDRVATISVNGKSRQITIE